MTEEPSAYSLEISAEALRLTAKHISKLPGWLGFLPGLQDKLLSVADWLQEKADAKLAPEPSEEDLENVRRLLEGSSVAASLLSATMKAREKR